MPIIKWKYNICYFTAIIVKIKQNRVFKNLNICVVIISSIILLKIPLKTLK